MINKVILIGNVGADPDVTYVKENQPIAHIRLATTERGYTLQDGTQVPERTEWHRVSVFGGLARTVETYVKKGMQIYVEGRLHYSQYQDKNNETRYSTDIIANDIKFLGRKPSSEGASNATEQPTAADIVKESQSDFGNNQSVDSDLPF